MRGRVARQGHELDGVGSVHEETTSSVSGDATFIGIDYHKAYSVYCVLDALGGELERGRIDHASPEDFGTLVRRWPGCRVVFEASMNWHWLFELLETEVERRADLPGRIPSRHGSLLRPRSRPTRWMRHSGRFVTRQADFQRPYSGSEDPEIKEVAPALFLNSQRPAGPMPEGCARAGAQHFARAGLKHPICPALGPPRHRSVTARHFCLNSDD